MQRPTSIANRTNLIGWRHGWYRRTNTSRSCCLRDGDRKEHVAQTYAEAHGLDVAEVSERALYVVFVTP